MGASKLCSSVESSRLSGRSSPGHRQCCLDGEVCGRTWMSASICFSRGSSSWGWRRVKRGISILLRDAKKALRNGSAGHSAAGAGSSPFSSLLCRITYKACQAAGPCLHWTLTLQGLSGWCSDDIF